MDEEKADQGSGAEGQSEGISVKGNPVVEGLIQKAYNSLKNADPEQALNILQEALKIDFEDPEVIFALKCISWWFERIEHLGDFRNPYEKGGFLLSQWKPFYTFTGRILKDDHRGGPGIAYDSCQYALRRYVFSTALSIFAEALEGNHGEMESETLLQIGRCYKGSGNYEEALKYLEKAASSQKDDPAILSELADVNALLGDERAAKVLFREAFFLDPQCIDLESMESEMIFRLSRQVAAMGYPKEEIAEWIPVFGCIWGVFSVKRELKPVELGQLKQSILSLENEIRSGSEQANLRPRLLNKYFRLVDYYEGIRSGTASRGSSVLEYADAVAEIMLKIKFMDPAIYERYKN
jgi:Tfp pilus assembly protein PilF